jgi:hypothetical protein
MIFKRKDSSLIRPARAWIKYAVPVTSCHHNMIYNKRKDGFLIRPKGALTQKRTANRGNQNEKLFRYRNSASCTFCIPNSFELRMSKPALHVSIVSWKSVTYRLSTLDIKDSDSFLTCFRLFLKYGVSENCLMRFPRHFQECCRAPTTMSRQPSWAWSPPVCMYMYTCMYTYIYVCVCMCLCICICICKNR